MKKLLSMLLVTGMVISMTACGSGESASTQDEPQQEAAESTDATPESTSEESADIAQLEDATVYIDIAASLEAVFADKIIPAFNEKYPNITIEYNAGSSGALLTGIEEANGVGHDLFFSAGKAQVTTLNEEDGMVIDGSIVELLSNQLCLVKGNDVETEVTGWDTLDKAKTAAICAGSVPVGKYTRIALVALGYLDETDDPSTYTASELSEALGGVEIDEADDVEVAAAKAVEGSVEVATIYYSDYYNHADDLTIIAQDDGTLTGNIIYPVCLVNNPEADAAETAAAKALEEFIQTDACLAAFEEYDFIVNK